MGKAYSSLFVLEVVSSRDNNDNNNDNNNNNNNDNNNNYNNNYNNNNSFIYSSRSLQ